MRGGNEKRASFFPKAGNAFRFDYVLSSEYSLKPIPANHRIKLPYKQ